MNTHDIVPELLEAISKDFEAELEKSEVIKRTLLALQNKKANYQTAHEFAIEVGEILSDSLGAHLSADKLPDGKMYYNIAERILNDRLKANYSLIANYSTEVQKILNEQAKIGLVAQKAVFNQERVDGFINRLTSEDNFDEIKWLVGSPINNFCQSVVDDTVKENASFHKKTGLSPKIVRRSTRNCCKWCAGLVGHYEYGTEPKDIYRRHKNCRCVVDYHPGNGKKQNVHSKQWSQPSKSDKIEVRKGLNLKVQTGAQNYFRDRSKDGFYSKEYVRREEHAYRTYDKIKNSNQDIEKRKIYSNIGMFHEMKDFTKNDLDIAFNHVFNDIHDLVEGQVLFAPSIETAESWDRLITGKDIQPHDLLMLRHERLEHDLMYVTDSLSYDDAHELVNRKYDYSSAAKKYEEGRKR